MEYFMKNSQIIEIFNRFKNNPKMHTEFYHGGCVQRTKAICDYILGNKDYSNDEILFTKIIPQNSSFIICETPYIQDSKTAPIKWTEHWVPIVYDEKNERVVLDICLMDGPERLSDYILHFSNAQIVESNMCNARDSLDYDLFFMALNNGRTLELVALDEENIKIHPNMEKSHWLADYNKKEKSRNKNNSSFLQITNKLKNGRL